MQLMLYGWRPFYLQCLSTGDNIRLDSLAKHLFAMKRGYKYRERLKNSIDYWSVGFYNKIDDNTNGP